jgi:hypothetical protein
MNALGNATLLAAAEGNSVKAARILDVQEAAYEEMGRSPRSRAKDNRTVCRGGTHPAW